MTSRSVDEAGAHRSGARVMGALASPEQWARLAALFERAADASAEERPALLAASCGDDEELRREVEAMLDADDVRRALLIECKLAIDDAGSPNDAALEAGALVGRYRIVAPLGAGGIADVYRAERADGAYRQSVALKVLRHGYRTANLVRRFRVEREALARLVHPGGATILDGGTLDDGRPFIVLELVDGAPITTFCEAQGLSLHERLALFEQVARVVHFAHTRLVVHRDLKPSNILVERDGRPRLLDFGIAKLLDPEPSASLVVDTMPEARLLTPEYASPEQVRGEAAGVSADVHALGAVLFEMLTGRTPFAHLRGDQRALQRAIVDTAPAAPSRLVASRAAARALRGDVDRIVLKALRKEPERRYRTAEQLADDVARWLVGRPVLARPDSVVYRLRKFVSRNGAAIAATAAGVLLALALGAMAAIQADRIVREHARAERERVAVDGALALLDRLRSRPEVGVRALADSVGVRRPVPEGADLDSSVAELRRLHDEARDERRAAMDSVQPLPGPEW